MHASWGEVVWFNEKDRLPTATHDVSGFLPSEPMKAIYSTCCVLQGFNGRVTRCEQTAPLYVEDG